MNTRFATRRGQSVFGSAVFVRAAHSTISCSYRRWSCPFARPIPRDIMIIRLCERVASSSVVKAQSCTLRKRREMGFERHIELLDFHHRPYVCSWQLNISANAPASSWPRARESLACLVGGLSLPPRLAQPSSPSGFRIRCEARVPLPESEKHAPDDTGGAVRNAAAAGEMAEVCTSTASHIRHRISYSHSTSLVLPSISCPRGPWARGTTR
ncbi:hypothetical protein MRB53_041287 [Persea americana]|nr:hypothetical protein MRB53_041287 [Persea americana]